MKNPAVQEFLVHTKFGYYLGKVSLGKKIPQTQSSRMDTWMDTLKASSLTKQEQSTVKNL